MEMADFLDVRPWALMWGAKGTRETKKNSVLTIHGYQKKEKMNFVQYLANLLDVDQISHQNWV